MSTATINIGHYARTPKHIIRADVSSTAKTVWMELALNSSPEKPIVWVRQASIAENLNLCTKTIARALQELLKKGLLKIAGLFQGRFVRYQLAWLGKFVQGPSPSKSEVPRQECPPIIRVPKQINKQNTSYEQELEKHEEEWKIKFPCIDGHSGRPTIRECVKQAWCHVARKKYSDPQVYLESWLRNASLPLVEQYNREKRALEELKKKTESVSPYRHQAPLEKKPVYSPELQKKLNELMREKKDGFAFEMLDLMNKEALLSLPDSFRQSKP